MAFGDFFRFRSIASGQSVSTSTVLKASIKPHTKYLGKEFMACARTIHREIAQPHIVGITFSYCAIGLIGFPPSVAFYNVNEWLPRSDDAVDDDAMVKRVLGMMKTPLSP